MKTIHLNSGDTKDEVSNIYDMAGNLLEWTTEYSMNTYINSYRSPCVDRGGNY